MGWFGGRRNTNLCENGRGAVAFRPWHFARHLILPLMPRQIRGGT